MSIRAKLLLGFTIMLAFTLGAAAVTYITVDRSNYLVREAVNNKFSASLFISQMSIEGQKLRRYEKEYFIYLDNFSRRVRYYDEWSSAVNKIKKLLATTNKQNTWSEEDLQQLSAWEKSLDEYAAGFNEVHRQVNQGIINTTLDANAAVASAKNKFKVFLKGTSEYGSTIYEQASHSVHNINNNFELIYQVVIIGAIGAVVLCLLLLFIIPSSITDPIEQLTYTAKEMSNGNLEKKVPLSNNRDFRILSQALEQLRITQRELMIRYLANEDYKKRA